MGRHASGPLLRLHRDGWLSWRVAKEAPYPLTAARLFPIRTEFPAWMRHQKRFGAQKSSRDGQRCPVGMRKMSPRRGRRAATARAGGARCPCVFSPDAPLPGAGEGRRMLGLGRALGYAGRMSTHSRSFPAPRRGAVHEEQAPQEADREEEKRSAPRRRGGDKASPEQGADRQGPSRRSGRRVSGEPAAQAPARARTGRSRKTEQPEAAGEAHVLPRWRQERREQRREARQQEQVHLARRWPDLPRSALPREDFSV